MIYKDAKAIDANWRKLTINGIDIPVFKTDFEVKRDTEKVKRSGSNGARARTIGDYNVEDSTWEFDAMGAVKFVSVFGITDTNPTLTSFSGLEFEAIEHVSDPTPGIGNIVSNAGAYTNIVKGCEVIGVKWSTEQGPAAIKLTVVVSILDAELMRGAAGGGFTLGLAK